MLCADRKVGATFDSEASASAHPQPTHLPTSQNLLHVCSRSSKSGWWSSDPYVIIRVSRIFSKLQFPTFDSEVSAQPPTHQPANQSTVKVSSTSVSGQVRLVQWSSGPVIHMWLSESAELLASFSFPLLTVRLVLTPTHPTTRQPVRCQS